MHLNNLLTTLMGRPIKTQQIHVLDLIPSNSQAIVVREILATALLDMDNNEIMHDHSLCILMDKITPKPHHCDAYHKTSNKPTHF